LRSHAKASNAPAPIRDRSAEEERNPNRKNDFWGIFALFVWGKKSKAGLATALFLILISSATTMAAAWALGALVQALANGSTALYNFAAMFIAFEIIAVALQYLGRIKLARITTQIITDIRAELFTKSTQLPISYFDAQPLGRILTRMTSDVEGIETFFSGTLARILIATIQIISVMTAMLLISPKFGLIVCLSCIPSIFIAWLTRTPVRESLRDYKRRSAHVNARLAEFLNGISIIKLFGLEEWTQQIFREDTRGLLAAGIRTLNLNSIIRPVVVLFCTIPTMCVIWVGGHQVIEGSLALGLLVSFIRLCERFMSPVRTISQEIQLIQEAMVSTERVRQMLGEKTESDVLGHEGRIHRPIRGEVEYRSVAMSYQTGKQVLRGISFKAQAGEKIALVGQTGSGKTTTVNLLPRFYEYSGGDILLDGISLREWSRSSLRKQLGYVTQDVVIFRGSMRDNLTAACAVEDQVPDSQILAACRLTGLDRVLASLTQGLDSPVLDEGTNLSMGERQLVSFTRMILKSPAILILDEATANIDEEHEKLIHAAMLEVLKGRTCFIVAHRLSTVLNCDRILVFSNGEIIAQGSHQELMQHSNYYRELVKTQISTETTHNSTVVCAGSHSPSLYC
jgi:ATP-binding cassette subfamily B multidrug efflux pump